MNDTFIEQLIEERRDVTLASTIDDNLIQVGGNFDGQPTIFAREIEALLAAGYTEVGSSLVPPP